MKESESRSIAPSALYCEYAPEDYRAAAREWLNTCTQYTNNIETQEENIAYLDFRSQLNHEDLLLDLMRKLPFRASLGLGSSKWLAHLAAQEFELTPVQLGLAQLPTRTDHMTVPVTLLPLGSEIIDRLIELGIKKISDLNALHPMQLRPHFPNHFRDLTALSQGQDPKAFLANFPEKSISQQVQFPGGTLDSQQVESAVRKLAIQLSQSLLSQGYVAQRVTLDQRFEDGPMVQHERFFAKPLKHFSAIQLAALTMLHQEQIDAPLTHIILRLHELEPDTSCQSSLFINSEWRDASGTVRNAVKSLNMTFGSQAVISAKDHKYPRREQLMKVWKNALQWK